MTKWKIVPGALRAGARSTWGWVTNQWKWLVIGVAVLAVVAVGWKVWSVFQERDQLREQAAGTITNLAQDLVIARTEADSAHAAIERLRADRQRLHALLENTLLAQEEIRDEVRAQQEIFERHRFDRLVQAKPGLIENRANRATQERFDALEDAFNE